MRTCCLAIAVIVAALVPLRAGATLAPGAAPCRRAVAFAGAQVFRASAAILASCQRRVALGVLPAATECVAPTADARAALAARFERTIGAHCGDATAAALGLGGDCAGARRAADLTGCIEGSHAAAAAAITAVASDGALTPAAARCQAQALAQATAVSLTRLRALQQCKLSPPFDLAAGSDCGADPRVATRVAARRNLGAARIAATCPLSAFVGTRFRVPCPAPANAADLAQCIFDVAEGAADAAVAAEFRDGGFCGDAPAVEQRIDALLGQMTLAEKVEQMHGVGLAGVYLTGRVDRLGIPGFGMIDGPRGVSLLTGNATAFPAASARGATWDPALEERVGEAIGVEARAKGASVILAPVLNILRHPRWGRAQETYGEDTYHLGRMGVGFIRGAQRHVVASAKHFAANSIEDTRFTVDVSIDERSLREIYLPHFRAAVQQAHGASIMSAYNQVNGHYCAENAHLLHDVLKDDWGFQGFVESDWILGTRSTIPSANAGLDIEMPVPVYYGQPLLDAVTAGAVSEATIDAAVRRIVRAQLCFRLDTDPPQRDPTQVETPAHAQLALEVARKGLVLLKNERSALPLDRDQLQSIVVVGGLAAMANLGDHGSSYVTSSHPVAPLDGIRAAAGGATVTHVASAALSASDQAAVAAADAAVVVVGLTFADEGEQLDRTSLTLSPDQDQLVAAVASLNPRTIVVLEGSGPFTMPWIDDVDAVLMAWYPGQAGGTAIAEILFGDVTPSGKLPVSFPRAEADLPPFDNVSAAVTYGYFHGYRYLDHNGAAPLFPFGFGLSYTTFAYSNLSIAPATVTPYGHVRVTADVTNTGTVAGDEIAQLYVGYQGSRVDRALNDLKGFARVHLEAGETQTVVFDVRAADVAFWDAAAGAWEVEPITYDVRVGPSSRQLPLTGSFAVGK